MKIPIKTLLFLLTVVLLSQCEKDEPNPKVTIPNYNFLNALIELGIDTNGDGIISPAEAELILSLDVSEESISDMTGIEAFVNLSFLNCGGNKLISLDVSNNTALIELDCSWNYPLTTLDVSNNTALERLSCWSNQLTTLDVSNNTALYWLYCGGNQLTTLDVSNNTVLYWLYCGGSQLISLDVSNNTALERLFCFGNNLTSLDVSNNTALYWLSCTDNQLTTLDVSNNTALSWLHLTNMPSLYKVCVWEMPFPTAKVVVDTTDSPNVYFTTDCSK